MTIKNVVKSLLRLAGGVLEGMSGNRYLENEKDFLNLKNYLENRGVLYKVRDFRVGKTDGGVVVKRGCELLTGEIVFTVEEAKRIIEQSSLSPYV